MINFLVESFSILDLRFFFNKIFFFLNSLSLDSFLIQYLFLFFIMNLFTNANVFYTFFYFIGIVTVSGLFLSLYNLEIFAAFLWMAEVIVALVSLFLIFNVAPSGTFQKKKNSLEGYKNYMCIGFGVVLSSFTVVSNYSNFIYSSFLIDIYVWEDYYEAFSNINSNDLYGFFLSYYYVNSLEFILIGLCLLIASLAFVNLNKYLYSNKINEYQNTFSIFDFFKNLNKNIFLRKQNLVDQENATPSARKFKKK